ncbi:sortase A [Actinacidiphila yanglinensis]|uniref:Sortase A n=1 Tax=Actinacidiphila yanglinensis TaxID=310779 RepID=A0A1H6A6T9_9ACTN|nr:class E sortase [Actinacidiphila yanglinensis]SEG43446.1 sortase A [Actinacidiphila yanglinensis]
MTTLRPERPADSPMSYEDTGQFEVAVGQLADPLNDPLPGRSPAVDERPNGSPWFSAPETARSAPREMPPQMAQQPLPPVAHQPMAAQPMAPQPMAHPSMAPPQPMAPAPAPAPIPVPEPDRTAQLPLVAEPDLPADPAPTVATPTLAPSPDGSDSAPGPDRPAAETAAAPVDGGRAARRKAAARGGHRARGRNAAAAAGAAGSGAAQEPAVPLSRVEARRAAKAAKDSPAVVISRVVGELFITVGVVMLLFVTYQLWWTNVRAHAQANSASNNLEHQWDTAQGDPNRAPGTFSPGQGFAIMYIPKLDVKAPIAQGVSTTQVLNKGMIGHYDGAPTNTAMPWDKTGNFAVAAHRNTHGEPFRYINRLVPGDKVVVETATTYYTYTITSALASTPPSNVSVLQPIPPGSGFTQPGRYLTLTTCTPEFTSTNRLIVWGKLTEERARSKGKPDALVNG